MTGVQLYGALISGVPMECKPKKFMVTHAEWEPCVDHDFDIGYYDYRIAECAKIEDLENKPKQNFLSIN